MGYSGCNRDGEPRCARLLNRRGKQKTGGLLPSNGRRLAGGKGTCPSRSCYALGWASGGLMGQVIGQTPIDHKRNCSSYAERPPAATFREGTSGPGGRKAPKDALVSGRVRCPSAEFSSSRPAPKGRERECRPFINRALHESSGSYAMEGWMLAASTVFIIRVGRVENPIRAPDKRLNNSEQNLKMERSARALCTPMIGFRPWI